MEWHFRTNENVAQENILPENNQRRMSDGIKFRTSMNFDSVEWRELLLTCGQFTAQTVEIIASWGEVISS